MIEPRRSPRVAAQQARVRPSQGVPVPPLPAAAAGVPVAPVDRDRELLDLAVRFARRVARGWEDALVEAVTDLRSTGDAVVRLVEARGRTTAIVLCLLAAAVSGAAMIASRLVFAASMKGLRAATHEWRSARAAFVVLLFLPVLFLTSSSAAAYAFGMAVAGASLAVM